MQSNSFSAAVDACGAEPGILDNSNNNQFVERGIEIKMEEEEKEEEFDTWTFISVNIFFHQNQITNSVIYKLNVTIF